MGGKSGKFPPTKLEQLERETNFSKKELKSWYKKFGMDCPTGVLTLEDFKTVYSIYYPMGNSELLATLVFKTFDSDEDNVVNFEEYIKSLSKSCRGSMDERLQWVFSLLDVDRDSVLSRNDLVTVVRAIYNSQYVHPSILPNDEITPEQKVDKLLSLMGASPSDISEEVFIMVCKQNDDVRELFGRTECFLTKI